MKKTNIIIVGVGGQGILLTSKTPPPAKIFWASPLPN